MQQRRKKQKRAVDVEEEKVVHATTTTTSVEYSRNWLELPGLPLHSVVDFLAASPDPLDLLSFASVCRHWHAFAASITPSLACPHPLLLLPSPVLAPRYRRCHNTRTLTLVNIRTLEPFPCKIPSRTLALPYAGYSHGHLVFVPFGRYVVRSVVLANVFSGRLYSIRTPPEFPRRFRFALVTDTGLLLLTASSLLFRYRRHVHGGATGSWSRLDLSFSGRTMTSLAVVRDRLYCLDSLSQLLVLQLGGGAAAASSSSKKPKWKMFGASAPSGLWSLSSQHLVQCGGELLLLNMALQPEAAAAAGARRRRVKVYKLETEGEGERLEWVEVESLGDWCIFVDPMGSCPAACREPARWGGRSNCVYVAVQGCSCNGNGWLVVPLDVDRTGEEEEVGDGGGGGGQSRWGKLSLDQPPWPSPLWVFPRTLRWLEKHTLI